MGLFDGMGGYFGGGGTSASPDSNPMLDPRAMMLMGLSQGLLNASAPSPVRQSPFAVIGQGALGAMQGRMQAMQNQSLQTQLQQQQQNLKQSQFSYGADTNKTLGLLNYFRQKAGKKPLTLEDLMSGKGVDIGTDAGAASVTTPDLAPAPSSAPGITGQTSMLTPSGQAAAAQSGIFPGSASGTVPSIMMAESRGNPNAVSLKGATGLMQLMPKTARNPGFGIAPAKDNSPEENMRVGSQYYSALVNKYGGNQAHALIAYNWGPGNTDKWIASGADPRKLPAETRSYVGTIATSMAGKNGDAQGLGQFIPGFPSGSPGAQLAQSMSGGGGAPPAQAVPSLSDTAAQLGMYDPAMGEQMLVHQAENARTTLTPDELKAAGFPAGTVVQRSPTGEMSVLDKPPEPTPPMSPEAFQQQKDLWGVKSGINPDGQPGSIGNMSRDTIHYWGQVVRNGGQLPPLGMGPLAARLRQAILADAASSDIQGGGSGAEHVATVATAKAGTQTLSKVTALRAASESYENTMLQNITLAKQMMGKGAGQYGAPVINRWVQYIRKDYAGDPDVAAFNTAVQTVKNEYAKIQSGSLGNAPVTDAARREAEGMLDANQTPQQIQANFDYMTQETGNRLRALRAQEVALRSGLSGKSDIPTVAGVTEPQSGSGGGKQKFVNGQIYKDAKGNKAQYQNGKWTAVQ